MLSIAYLGNFLSPWCTEVHIKRDLEALGHKVTEFQEPIRGGQALQRGVLSELENWCVINRPDLLLYTRTREMPPIATSVWRRVERLGVVTASIHLDLYVGLERLKTIGRDPFWTTQHVFTADGDPATEVEFKRRRIRHHWSSPAIVSDEAILGKKRKKYDYDVVFVGSAGYHPEWPWRGQLTTFLKDRYGDRFRHFGNSALEGQTRGMDLNDLYASAKVVVGDSLQLPGHSNYWSDRYFETIGRGGFLVGPQVPGLDAFLTPYLHYMPYQHPNENLSTEEALAKLGSTIDGCLTDPSLRKMIRTEGQKHVREHHTYKNRLAVALETMKLTAPAPEPIEKLELGSGYSPTPGFTHLDSNPQTRPDIVGSAWPLRMPDNSVGEIRAVDVLEHLSYMHTEAVLADWFRVLRPGGRIYIQVPDAEMIMHWFVDLPQLLVERLPDYLPQTPLAGATWRLLGGHNDGVYVKDDDHWMMNAHYALFSPVSLRLALETAGFEIESLVGNPHPNLLCWAVKPG
jgi:SAM-dependent methyltransferase